MNDLVKITIDKYQEKSPRYIHIDILYETIDDWIRQDFMMEDVLFDLINSEIQSKIHEFVQDLKTIQNTKHTHGQSALEWKDEEVKYEDED